MNQKFKITKMIALVFISILCLSCENSDEVVSRNIGTTPRALGPWQRTFIDNFGNTNNWQKANRFDYNSNVCQYDPAVPTIGYYDGRQVLVLTATKSGSIWKSGHVKSNYSFKPGNNEEYRVSAQVKLVAMDGANYRAFRDSYGVWPAFWTVQESNWPTQGEIDIFEGYSFGGSIK
jgi:hypothetical protein